MDYVDGAGDGNRTHMAGLEGQGSTIELRPLSCSHKKLGRTGFEPVKAKPTGLQPAPFDRSGISPCYLAFAGLNLRKLAEGVEPTTIRLQGGCSTVELR